MWEFKILGILINDYYYYTTWCEPQDFTWQGNVNLPAQVQLAVCKLMLNPPYLCFEEAKF